MNGKIEGAYTGRSLPCNGLRLSSNLRLTNLTYRMTSERTVTMLDQFSLLDL